MRQLFFLLAAPLLPLFLAAPAQAAFDPALVSGEAQWVIHLDLNTLRDTVLGKEMIAQVEKQMPPASETGDLKVNFQKLFATVGNATAYGVNFASDPKSFDGALVLQGTPDLRKIAEAWLLQATITEPKHVSEISDLGFDAYLIDKEVIIAFPPEPVVIVSKSKAQVKKARDILRGSAPSLAKTPASPLHKLIGRQGDAYLFAASIVPSEKIIPDDAPQARILKMANSGALALREKDGTTSAHVELVAVSDANAEKLMKILQGLTAMLSLAASDNRQITDFLNSAKVNRDNNTVTLDLSYASAGLVKLVNNLQQDHSGPRAQPITIGKTVAEWTAADMADASSTAEGVVVRTVENVTLTNGGYITLGRSLNGGKNARFDRLEAVSVDGGAPLIFKRDFMRQLGNNMVQIQFPGADGRYNLKVAFTNDPEGKAKFAVSLREPRSSQPPTEKKPVEKKSEDKKSEDKK